MVGPISSGYSQIIFIPLATKKTRWHTTKIKAPEANGEYEIESKPQSNEEYPFCDICMII